MSETFADRRQVLGGGALIAGAGALAATATTRASAQATGDWKPTLSDTDAWMNKDGTLHRMVFDTTTPDAAAAGFGYANNFYLANKSGYGIEPKEIGMIVILRHMSTPFGYNDKVWAEYGKAFAKFLPLKGEEALRAATMNPMLTPGPDDKPGPGDDKPLSISSLAEKGARFAICGMATAGIAGMLAKGANKEASEVEEFLKANLVPGGVIVAAGVVAINRAQEHGYTFAYVQE